MKYRDLWKIVEECIETFDLLPQSTRVTPDEHINDVLSGHFDMTEGDVVFVREAAGGVFRYRRLVDLTLEAFCEGMKRNKQDYISLYIISYLLIFRFREIGGRTFRQLINKSTSSVKIAEFIGFLLNEDMLRTFAFPKWATLYDDKYVEEHLIQNLLSIKDEVDTTVLQWYLDKATTVNKNATSPDARQSEEHILKKSNSPKFSRGKKSQATAKMPPAEVREMLATVPEQMPPVIKCIPTEGELNCVEAAKSGKKLSALTEEVKAKNREREKAIPFHEFKQTDRPSDLPRLLDEKVLQEEEECKPLKFERKRYVQHTDVKLTAAALRREEIIYRRRRENEAAAILRKEQEMRDDSEYQNWKAKAELEEKVATEAKIAQRKLDMMLADEEAKATRKRQELANQEISRQFRAEQQAWRDHFGKEQMKQVTEYQQQAKDIRTGLAMNVRSAVARVVDEKHQLAQDLKREKEENELKVATALELERERKQELIAEIKRIHEESNRLRAEERVRRRHPRCADEKCDVGQLVTMSWEELQAKLQEVKEERTVLVEKKRNEIVQQRELKKEEEERMKQEIELHRQAFRDDKERNREEKRREAELVAQRLRVQEEQKLFVLQEKLQIKREQRKAETEKRKEEERQRRLAAQLLSADAGAIEVEKWREMERGQENTIVAAQNTRIAENRAEREKQRSIVSQRRRNIEEAEKQHSADRQQIDATLHAKKQQYVSGAERDERVRKQAFSEMKREKEEMIQRMRGDGGKSFKERTGTA